MEKTSNKSRRVRKPRRLVRRLTLGLGLALALTPASAGARDRSPLSPRRAQGAQPPWIESGGSPPPRPPDSTEDRGHPALHGKRTGKSVSPLFPRTGRPARDKANRERAMAAHPAGKGREHSTVTVETGDSLWSLADGMVERKAVSNCWPALYRANRDVVGPDPAHIEPGQKLDIPKECT